jgi:hypothetical protein
VNLRPPARLRNSWTTMWRLVKNLESSPASRSGGHPIFLVCPTRHDLERIIRQRPLQRLRLIPRRAQPHVAPLVGRQDRRHGLRVDWFNNCARGCRQEAINKMWTGYRLRFRTTVASELSPNSANAQSGRSSLSANQTTSFFLVSGLGSGAHSAKLFSGTRQRCSGLSQPRQCGELVLRILVTGGPPVAVAAFPNASSPVRARLQSCAPREPDSPGNPRHRRQVADIVVDRAEQGNDGGLVRGDAIEIAH